MSLVLRCSAIAAVLTLSWQLSGCTCGTQPYEGDYVEDDDRPGKLAKVKFQESEKGAPELIGCADGQREAFADLKKFPRVAGCLGNWKGKKSLRAKKGSEGCGDDGSKCEAPADVCAPGWHVCGSNGRAADLKDRVSAKDCHNAGPGRFNAGMSHGQNDELCPPKPTAKTVFPCTRSGIGSEPVCCGADCSYGECRDGVWTGKTKISVGTSEGCGGATAEHNGGVLCCYDGDEDPVAPADAAATAGDAAATEGAKEGDAKAEAKGKDEANKDGAAPESDGQAKAKAKAVVDAPAKAKGKAATKSQAKPAPDAK